MNFSENLFLPLIDIRAGFLPDHVLATHKASPPRLDPGIKTGTRA